MAERHFDFHGIHVVVTGDEGTAADLARDFSYFERPPSPLPAEVRLTLHAAAPPWEDAAEVPSVLVRPACVIYEANDVRWVDYQGKALCRWDYRTESGELWSEHGELLYELAYLLLLSRIGEIHDRQGLHRIHALGLEVGGRGIVCCIPSGGGKTTLGMAALRYSTARLLSDDTPLVTRTGDLLAFPNRIGTLGPPEGVPADKVRRFVRRQRGDKYLVDVGAYADRLAPQAAPGLFVLGERQLKGRARIEPVSRRAAFAELVRSLVVGVGLPQVVEYFVRFTPGDIARKAAFVGSRTLAATALLRRSKAYKLYLSRNLEENVEALLGVLGRGGT